MENVAVIATVKPLTHRRIGESLEIEFLNVTFRVLRSNANEGRVYKAVIKEPDWLSMLQPSAPLDGYLLEHGEFSASLAKDDRITPGLEVTLTINAK